VVNALLSLAKRHHLDDVIRWLKYAPETPWSEFKTHRGLVPAELDAIQEARMKEHLALLKELKTWPRPACPKCGLDDEVVPILYGYLDWPPLPTDVFVWGGCIVGEERWHCKQCGLSWPRFSQTGFFSKRFHPLSQASVVGFQSTPKVLEAT
jgi:hypothetical protein